MAAYYNEIDPFAAAWLRELISAGHIAPGDVDTRSIVDVSPSDLRPYAQCHFFAGIGVWSYALRRAGWADDRPVWTGSCPCQPFSAAGKGGGFDDERHLWPAFHHLIVQCGPAVVFGEQVASKDADPWIDLVQADMEALGYAFGAVPFPSAGVGAPHIRDRTYWLADAESVSRGAGLRNRRPPRSREPVSGDSGAILGLEYGAGDGWIERRAEPSGRGAASGCSLGGPADDYDAEWRPDCPGWDDTDWNDAGRAQGASHAEGRAEPGGMASADSERQQQSAVRSVHNDEHNAQSCSGVGQGQPGPINGFWRDADWLHCRDVKWRPVEPGTFPLAHGAPARVGRLRGYGNAINAVAAETFIAAYLEKDVVEIDAERVRLTGLFA